MVERFRVKPEVGESFLIFQQEGVDARMPVPDLAGRDDLVARMRERRDAAIEIVGVLGLHVLPDCRFSLARLEIDAHARPGATTWPGREPPPGFAPRAARWVCPSRRRPAGA